MCALFFCWAFQTKKHIVKRSKNTPRNTASHRHNVITNTSRTTSHRSFTDLHSDYIDHSMKLNKTFIETSIDYLPNIFSIYGCTAKWRFTLGDDVPTVPTVTVVLGFAFLRFFRGLVAGRDVPSIIGVTTAWNDAAATVSIPDMSSTFVTVVTTVCPSTLSSPSPSAGVSCGWISEIMAASSGELWNVWPLSVISDVVEGSVALEVTQIV